MANFDITWRNGLIGNADPILQYLTGRYMEQHLGSLLGLSDDSYRLDDFTYRQILSYRREESEEAARKRTLAMAAQCLSLLYAEDGGFGFFVHSDGSELHIALASEQKCRVDIAAYLQAGIPALTCRDCPEILRDWKRCSAWGGVVVSPASIDGSYIDPLLEGMLHAPGVLGIVAVPSARAAAYLSGLMELSGQLHALEGYTDAYGTGSRRAIKRTFPQTETLGAYLDRQIGRWKGVPGMWEGCIWFAAGSERDADRLGAMIAGALGGAGSLSEMSCMYFLTEHNPFQTGEFGIPLVEYTCRPPALPGSLVKGSLETFFAPQELAALVQLPAYSHPGFEVITGSGETSALRPFDIGGIPAGELALGRLPDGNAPFYLRLPDLTEHVLVTGATGSGKTNTVMRILQETLRQGIPYCIIEPSKKDYWQLAGQDASLNVYSAGQDALDLKLNPFIPEYGVDIGAHIHSLMYAFSGAFDMESPTRFALEGLIKFAYRANQWDLADIYHGQNRPIPQIQDLIDLLPSFMERELQYGQEVGDNIRGAIRNRLNSMNEGLVAQIIACPPGESLSGETLCTKNVLLELDDLPIDLKPFVTELALLKVNQYLRRRNASAQLRNIIVLEEAHNVFSEIRPGQAETSKTIASAYFSNLLSEIREYGTGIIIADQGASKINSNAVANTKVKILHSASSREDVAAEAYAMHLDERRMHYLPGFHIGEALVAIRGMAQVWRVEVARADRNALPNIACLLCVQKPFCIYERLRTAIPPRDGRLGATILSALRNSYDIAGWAELIRWVQNEWQLERCDKTCLLGYLLERYAESCGAREKRRILSLYNRYERWESNA